MISKDYLRYLFHGKRIAWIFFFAMYMAVSLSPFITGLNEMVTCFSTSMNISCILAIIMTFILPVFLFSFVHQKKSCDSYFALPVKRSEMLCTTILFAFLVTFAYYFITVLAATGLTIMHTGVTLTELFFCICYMAVVIFALLVIHSSIYLFANNLFDGIVMLMAYTVLPLVDISVIDTVCNTLQISFLVRNIDTTMLSPLAISFLNAESLIGNIEVLNPVKYLPTFSSSSFSFAESVALILFALIAGYLLKINFVNRRTERAEQVSNEVMSYPFIINFYLICVLIAFAFSCVWGIDEMYMIMYAFLFFIYMISVFVYKRKIAFYWKNAVYFLSVTLITVLIAQFCYINKGFGLPYTYPIRSGETVTYQYNAYNLDKQLKEEDDDNPEDCSISVNFDLTMKTSELDSDKYREVFDILENYRKDAITESLNNHEQFPDFHGFMSISNDTGKDNVYNDYYNPIHVLTLDELKAISKVTDVKIEVYDYNDDSDEIYTLNEYLERYGK